MDIIIQNEFYYIDIEIYTDMQTSELKDKICKIIIDKFDEKNSNFEGLEKAIRRILDR